MLTALLKQVPKSEQARLKTEFAASSRLLTALSQVIMEKLQTTEVFAKDEIDGGFPYKAADRNGYRRALKEVLKLMENDE